MHRSQSYCLVQYQATKTRTECHKSCTALLDHSRIIRNLYIAIAYQLIIIQYM